MACWVFLPQTATALRDGLGLHRLSRMRLSSSSSSSSSPTHSSFVSLSAFTSITLHFEHQASQQPLDTFVHLSSVIPLSFNFLRMSTGQAILDGFANQLMTIQAPEWYVNPEFPVVLAPILDQLSYSMPVSLAPGLAECMQSDTPPSFDFFTGLPEPERGAWCVYAVTLQKEGQEDVLYIGSGTGMSNAGCVDRTNQYRAGSKLPRFVALALREGYELVHIEMLCWMVKPPVDIYPRSRLRFLAYETVFTCLFFSCVKTVMEDWWSPLMPWKRESVPWDYGNSHLPLREGVGELLDLTEGELVAIDTMRRQRISQNSKEHYLREMENNYEEYTARKLREKLAWTAKNKDRVLATQAGVRARAIEAKRFWCEICKLALQSQTALDSHKTCDAHRQAEAIANGAAAPEPSDDAVRCRSFSAAARASGRFECKPCGYNTDRPAKLTQHKGTSRHLKTMAAAAKAAAAALGL